MIYNNSNTCDISIYSCNFRGDCSTGHVIMSLLYIVGYMKNIALVSLDLQTNMDLKNQMTIGH